MEIKCRWCGATMRIRSVRDDHDILNSSPLAIVFTCRQPACGHHDKIIYSKLDYKQVSDTEIVRNEDDDAAGLLLSVG